MNNAALVAKIGIDAADTESRIDPEKETIIVLLTNRVYPSRSYENLYDLDVRRKLVDIVIEN